MKIISITIPGAAPGILLVDMNSLRRIGCTLSVKQPSKKAITVTIEQGNCSEENFAQIKRMVEDVLDQEY